MRNCAPSRARTCHLILKRDLLYQMSYGGFFTEFYIEHYTISILDPIQQPRFYQTRC